MTLYWLIITSYLLLWRYVCSQQKTNFPKWSILKAKLLECLLEYIPLIYARQTELTVPILYLNSLNYLHLNRARQSFIPSGNQMFWNRHHACDNHYYFSLSTLCIKYNHHSVVLVHVVYVFCFVKFMYIHSEAVFDTKRISSGIIKLHLILWISGLVDSRYGWWVK